ncbi:MAG: S8 family serine peptidase [Microcoleus sp.]
MGWLNFGGKKRERAQGFGDSSKTKSRKRPKSFILEKIVTPSAGIGDWQHEFDHLHQLLGSLSLSDLHLPNFFADGGVCPIDPNGAPTNNLPPLIDFDPLGLYHDGIATQTPYNPGGAFETLPIAVIPVDPHSPNPNNPNAIRQLLDSPFADQPLLGTIDTGVSADSPYLNYANIKKGRDYVGGDDNPLLKPGEGSEHGTFMLGIIDAINKTAPKWVGRAIDSGRWADSLVEFVDAAKASGQKNAIANLSLDLTQKNADGIVETRYELTPPERSAIEYARQNGVLLVVAAGNDGGVMSVLGQASQEFDNIFTVGSGDINGRSIYSSYGRGLDILADGDTNEHPALSTAGNDLGTMAGTSVATAKVAGAASLVWAANPALNYRQVMEILEKTARDLGTSGWDDETGFGFLNTLAAVDLAKKTQPEVYNPIDFGTPTTWGGEGKVTPMERAVNFNGTIDWGKSSVQNNGGVNLRSGPGTGYDFLGTKNSGDTLEFDSQTQGDLVNDPNGEGSSNNWYRLADGSGWMSGLYVQYLGEIASPSPSPNPSPSPSPNPSPSPISTFSQTVGDVGYVHNLGFLRVRNGPGTDASGYQQVGTVSPGNTLIFDGQTQGESVYDPALGESATWYHLADGSGWVSALYMDAASTPTPSPSPSPTQPSATDNVRQMFSDAARQYPQVGAALTGVQDQGGGVFRQEFERAIMIWNGQQVTVYETKGRSVSPTSPSSEPQVNNSSGFTPVLNFNSGGKSPNGNWIFLNQGDKGQQIEQIKQKILNLENQINAIEASKATYGSQISEKEKAVKDKKDQANKLSWPNSWNPLDWLKAGQLTIEAGLIEYGTLPQLRAQYSATTTRLNELKQELVLSRQELDKLNPLPTSVAEAQRYFKSQFNPDAVKPNANCGPTSIAMALAVLNLELPGLTIQESIDKAKNFTLPWSQPAAGARDFEIVRGIEKAGGKNIEDIGKSPLLPEERWAALERCLSEGKPVVAFGKTNAEWSKSIGYPNNPVDHVIAILGKTPAPEGKYIVGDPEAQNCVAVTKEQLKDFFRIYGEAPAGRAFSR